MNTRADRWHFITLCAILLLSAALRFYRLGYQSFWNDEGTTAALAQRDIPTILRNAAADIHPPLYYLALRGWAFLTGTSEWALRSLSALSGVALVLVLYLIARHTVGGDAAAFAAFFAAVSPLQVYFSQETRMYMFACLLGALSWWCFLRLADLASAVSARNRSWVWSAAWLLVSVAAVYSHYVLFSVIFAQSFVAALLWLKQGIRRAWRWARVWLGLQLLLGLAYVPWLIRSWSSLISWPAVGAEFNVWQLLTRAGAVFGFGVTMPLNNLVTISGFALLAISLVVPLIGKPRPWTVCISLVVPLASFLVLSNSRAFFKDKFLLFIHPAYLILLAAASRRAGELLEKWLGKRWPGWLLSTVISATVLLCSLLSLTHLYFDPAFQRDDYRGLVAAIHASANADDAILINAPSQIETVGYYHQGPQPLVPIPQRRPPDKAETTRQLEELARGRRRIYGIFWATDESDPERIVESWLDTHTYKALDKWYGNLRLTMYAVPTQVSLQPDVPVSFRFGESVLLTGYTLSTPLVRAGDIVQLALYWRTDTRLSERYKVFIHLVDASGQIVAQRDSEPGGGAAITTIWEPGQPVVDRYGILLPEGLPTGQLTIRLGLYHLDGGQRLQVSLDDTVIGDYCEIGWVQVE